MTDLSSLHTLYSDFIANIEGCWNLSDLIQRLEKEPRHICDTYVLGYIYLHQSKTEKAVELLEKSVADGNDFAALTLAEEYIRGQLLPADVKKAEKWYNCYRQMPLCRFVLDCICQYDVNQVKKTIYQIDECDVNTSFKLSLFKAYGDPYWNLGDLWEKDCGAQLFKRLFDMIQWNERKDIFRYDEGKIFEKATFYDVDFIRDMKDISSAVIAYCELMEPILREREAKIDYIGDEESGIKADEEWVDIDFIELCKECPLDPIANYHLIINAVEEGNPSQAINLINGLSPELQQAIDNSIASDYLKLVLSALNGNENDYFKLADIDKNNSDLWLDLAEQSTNSAISNKAKQEKASRVAAQQAAEQARETQEQKEYIQSVLSNCNAWIKISCPTIQTIQKSIKDGRYEDAKKLLEEWIDMTEKKYINSVNSFLAWFFNIQATSRKWEIYCKNIDKQLLSKKELEKVFDKIIKYIPLEFWGSVAGGFYYSLGKNSIGAIPFDRLQNMDAAYLRFFLPYDWCKFIEEALREKASNDINALYVLAMYKKDKNDIIRCAENKEAITIEPSDDEEKALFEKMCYAIRNKDGLCAYELGWYELSDEWRYIHGAYAAKRYKKAVKQYADYFKDWYKKYNLTILQQILPEETQWQRYNSKAENGDIEAMLIIADGYMRGVNGLIEQDSKKACKFFRKAIKELEKNK